MKLKDMAFPDSGAIQNLKQYPEHGEFEVAGACGLTKREYFAGLAMQGLLSIPELHVEPRQIAYASVLNADALIAALSRDPSTPEK